MGVIGRDESWKPEGKKPNKKNNRTSLRSEVEETQRALGTGLREYLGQSFTDYLSAFNQVLQTPLRDDADVTTFVNAQRAVTERLVHPEGLDATWSDLRRAVEDLDVFSAANAAAQLQSQLDLAGRDGSRVLSDIVGILRRNAWSVGMAREVWGEGTAQPLAEVNAQETVDAPADEVMRLATRAVSETGREGHVVVWSMYDRAAISTTSRTLGPMTVFMAQYIVGVGFERHDEAPPAIEEFRGLRHVKRHYERGYDFRNDVIVRIDLGNRTPVGALDSARDLVETLMDALQSMGSLGRWGKTVWSEVLVDGEDWGGSFGRGSRAALTEDTYGMRGVDSFLEEASDHFGRALLERPVPWHLRGALRSCAEASHANSRAISLYGEWHNDERSIVLMLDSAFEHLAAFADTTAADLSKRISAVWPQADRDHLIVAMINVCLFSDYLSVRLPEDVEALKSEILTGAEGHDLRVAHHVLDRLVAVARSPLQGAAVQRLVGQLGDTTLYAEETERLTQNTNLLTDRQRRVRNALTHGNPVIRPVLASIVEFSHFRTKVALRAALEAFTESADLKDYLQTKEAERAEDEAAMRSGKSQIAIWDSRESVR